MQKWQKNVYVFNGVSVEQDCPVVRTACEQDPIGACTHTVRPADQPPAPATAHWRYLASWNRKKNKKTEYWKKNNNDTCEWDAK